MGKERNRTFWWRAVTCVIFGCFLFSFFIHVPTSHADEWFDSFERTSWDEERAHLYGLVVYLRQNPESNGYILKCYQNSEGKLVATRRMKLIRNFLKKQMRISLSRLVMSVGKCNVEQTILQPFEKKGELPSFEKLKENNSKK